MHNVALQSHYVSIIVFIKFKWQVKGWKNHPSKIVGD